MPDLLDRLNPEQLAAVTLPAGNALILAGAGSGKTRVLTTRIAWLIQTGQVSPAGVLAVTFTNKAAKEMLTRLAAMLPVNVRGMWVGTFHGLCNRFLRTHWKDARLPQSFQILDMQDQLSAIKRLMKQYGVDDERYPPKQLQWFINGAKEDGLRAAACVPSDDLSRKFIELYDLYDAQCNREGVVDFAELLLRTYELLRDNAALREHYRRRFRHVLVDEFQDTNNLQYAWLKCIAGTPADAQHASVFAVGDDDQSIYAFRGANVGNMQSYEREFQVRNLIKLEQNYRSHGNILDTANHLISHNRKRLGKNLRTDEGAGEPIRVYEAASDYQEAQWLIDEAQQLHREGTARSEIAVLYRSNAQSRVIEGALFNAGIAYRVYGGLRFFERAEVKHALAYLRLIENPHDDTSFLRVVNFPARGIGARTLEQLQDIARARECSLHDAVAQTTGKGGGNLQAFNALIERLRADTRGLTLQETVQHTIEGSGLAQHYQAEKEGRERLENLEELVNAAAGFVTQEGFGLDALALPLDEQAQAADTVDGETGETVSPLAAFLAHAALESGDNQAQAGQDALQLMTVHSAKGLEFDGVFITGLEEGLFPHENSMLEQDGIEEERRLMYVAITRARKRLYLSTCQTRMLHGQTRYNIKSRFFDELPDSAVKWITPRVGGLATEKSREYTASLRGEKPFTAYDTPQYQKQAAPAFRAGQSVFHNKFGEGVVITLEGQGADARAQVNFGRHGVKWLALGIARLTAI
ncbi:MAG: UvrD-helicase domain-containing protein [Betaproteobacteria bacterium]|nr:UvrD-helicase domain-containing protein [Betaproteobacteria bacterium]